jgi:hypothetical protein
MKQLATALTMYVGDFHAYPYSGYAPAANAKSVVFWFDALASYAGNNAWGSGVWRCPTYKWTVYEGKGDLANNGWFIPMGAYSYNGWGASPASGPNGWIRAGLGFPCFGTANGASRLVRESDVKAPSGLYAVGDAQLLSRWPNGWSGGQSDYSFLPLSAQGITNVIYQHPQGYNMAVVDGHAETVRADRLFSNDPLWRRRWNNDNNP